MDRIIRLMDRIIRKLFTVFKNIKVLIPSLQYLVTPDSWIFYHVVYIPVHTEQNLRKENNLYRKINTCSCIRHVTDLITYGARYSDNFVNGFVNGWHDFTWPSQILGHPKREGVGLRWGWVWGVTTRSFKLGVYFADFLRPKSLSLFYFLPIFGREKCSHISLYLLGLLKGDTSTPGKRTLLMGPETREFNSLSEDTLAIKQWLTTNIRLVDKFKIVEGFIVLVTMATAFTTWINSPPYQCTPLVEIQHTTSQR